MVGTAAWPPRPAAGPGRPFLGGGPPGRQWAEYHRHPWLLQVESSRPWIGPNGCDRYEWQLAAVDGTGLTDLQMDQVVTVIGSFTAGAARTSVLARRTTEDSGISDAQWWEANAPVLEKVMPPGAYPLAGRVGTAAGREYNAVGDPDRSFRFGLDRLLDGVAFLLPSGVRSR